MSNNFKIVATNKSVYTDGTFFQGNIITTYDRLVELFGKPMPEGDKTNAEWALQFSDGDEDVVATIYDWKMSQTPFHTYGWHIGGTDKRAVDLVHSVVKPMSTHQ